MCARLGATELIEVAAGFVDGGFEAFGLGALGVDKLLGAVLDGGVEGGGDAGLEEEFDDAGDEGLLACLDGDGFGEEAVGEEQVLFGGQRFERAEEAADGLRGGFNGGPGGWGAGGAKRGWGGFAGRRDQATPRAWCMPPASWVRSISAQPSRRSRTSFSTSMTGSTCLRMLASRRRRR